MIKKKINIWDRDFNLDVICEAYSGEPILESQKRAVEEFEGFIIDSVKAKVEEYILNHDRENVGKNFIDNIFKYVMPKSIYVPQINSRKVLAVLCHYKFDLEHGLAIVFENNELKDISEEDVIL